MWSATWPKKVIQMSTEYLSNYSQVNIGSKNLQANNNITQQVMMTKQNFKMDEYVLFYVLIYFEHGCKSVVAGSLLTKLLMYLGNFQIFIYGKGQKRHQTDILHAVELSQRSGKLCRHIPLSGTTIIGGNTLGICP